MPNGASRCAPLSGLLPIAQADAAFSAWPRRYKEKGFKLHQRFRYPRSDTDKAREVVGKHPGASVHTAGLHYLDTESIKIRIERDGVEHKIWKLFGSPWTPWFNGWAWNYGRGEEAKKLYSSIPADTDILLTHGPPHRLGGLDRIHKGTSVGCEELTRKAIDGEVRPRLWAFGHIHEARGVHRQEWSGTKVASSKSDPVTSSSGASSTLLVNAALVDYDMEKARTSKKMLNYKVVNQPIIVDLAADRV